MRSACSELGLPLRVSQRWGRPALRRDGPEHWTTELSAGRLREVARRRRRLVEAAGGDIRCVDRSGDPAAVEDFLALEASGWKGRAGTALQRSGPDSRCFRELCRRLAADGRLHVLELTAGGAPIAMYCASRSAGTLFLHRMAYDEEYATYGPGVLLVLATAEYFETDIDAVWMDSCCGPGNTFFPDLLPDRLAVSTATIGLRGPVGHAVVRALPHAVGARRRLRALGRHAASDRRVTIRRR